MKATDSLLSRLPDSIQITILNNEKNHTYGSPEYKQANRVWMEIFFARKLPRSADMDSGSTTFGSSVYRYMWGPTEFTATGTLKDYNRTNMLHKIKVPVLFLAGDHDEVLPSEARYYQSLVP